jgi:fimbrial chaperone protein
MSKRAMSQAACGLVLFMGACGAADAGSFAVNPVRATLSAARPVASFTVRNDGVEATVVQLEVMHWSQRDGKDVYVATREILATPPIFKIPPGGTQVVRVGSRRAPDSRRELTYRLFLQEVPPPLKDGFRGLRVTLRMGIPVFIVPPVATSAALRWTATRTPQGQIRVEVSNGGNAHVQIADVSVSLAGERELGRLTEAVYVLPGQSRNWMLPVKAPSGAVLHLVSRTDAGDLRAEVVVNGREQSVTEQ